MIRIVTIIVKRMDRKVIRIVLSVTNIVKVVTRISQIVKTRRFKYKIKTSSAEQDCTFSKCMAIFSPMLFSDIFELFPKFKRKSRHFWIHSKFHQNQNQVSNS